MTLSSHNRQKRTQAKQEASLALSRVFADQDEEEAMLMGRGASEQLTSRQPWQRDLVVGETETSPARWASMEVQNTSV